MYKVYGGSMYKVYGGSKQSYKIGEYRTIEQAEQAIKNRRAGSKAVVYLHGHFYAEYGY